MTVSFVAVFIAFLHSTARVLRTRQALQGYPAVHRVSGLLDQLGDGGEFGEARNAEGLPRQRVRRGGHARRVSSGRGVSLTGAVSAEGKMGES